MSINKALLDQARTLRLKRGLSQNFLVDDRVLEAVQQATRVTDSQEHPILEIGPGAGFLTERLLELPGSLTAVEVDPAMVKILTERFGERPDFQVIHRNVLQVDLSSLLSQQGVIVGNLPYHLTGPILFQIAGELADPAYTLRRQLHHAIVMVQKEVGERLIAKPGDKAYSQLTVSLQCWFETEPVIVAPKQAFYPSPKVDSMVVKLTPRLDPAIQVSNYKFLSRIVKTAFLHRRKTLFNNLKIGSIAPEAELKATLNRLGIPPEKRPQELSLQEYGAIANAFCPAS